MFAGGDQLDRKPRASCIGRIAQRELERYDGILVPGGFGKRGPSKA